ncbi:arginine--tRNA ligase [Amnibacterium kyonggiense]|uniref:Arginine--tRNA ligase n=1 Tax=Amnibacterium kyonggiense TaxID=595671 RepID=A0A4R7FGH7_9MICO|nr:arginine--tRNA ligase [Amnibacterium kyonggiense]TDS75785.1 arginyl-tRNA synthetase [Amnibacterium kyonggiense]
MTPAELQVAVGDLVRSAAARRGADLSLSDDQIVLERPRSREHGDWTSTVAMRVAKQIGVPPRDLAQELASGLGSLDGVAAVDVAGPGFINITLEAASAGALAARIVSEGEAYGRGDSLAGRSVNMEFVSANPTGPLHLAHTRWAALGDAISRVLRASGATVVDEYYINDAGSQMDHFGDSVLAAAKGEPTPEGGYPGQYIADLAAELVAENPELTQLPTDVARTLAKDFGYKRQLAEIQRSLEDFNVHFDVWFSERTLHDDTEGPSPIDVAVERLRAQGRVFESEGAVWLRTSDFGDDKDRVLVRSNGETTYFAADAAYYLDKRDRGYDEKVYLLGADHHGYIGRLKALAAAAGDDPDSVTVLIGQTVKVNGARLSKRAGNIVELVDLLDWLGTDSLRYWLARYPADTPLDLDGEQLRRRTNDNPVFYVQYAHARTRSVARKAAEADVTREHDGGDAFDPALLVHPTENDLLGELEQFPRTVERAATLREPHRVARYLEQLAGAYHRWYDSCRVIPVAGEPVEDVHRTRLVLNDAVAQVLRNGLGLLGVSAPERM